MLNEHQNSFEQLCSWDNLYFAWSKASKGKRSKQSVSLFESRLEENLISLQRNLQGQSWCPGGYVSFYIHDPKRRLISAAPFPDRVVHHALCNIIEPVFERSFVRESYANRIGKGNHRALQSTHDYSRKFAFVLQLDIRKFFPNIDHAVLRHLLTKKISDERIMWLIDSILESGQRVLCNERHAHLFPGDDLLSLMRPCGLPIGNLTSQFWANVYMNPLDHFIKRELRCKGYVRYVDDLLLFSDVKETLWNWQQVIEKRLQQMRLQFHSGSHPKPVSEGISFLGFRVFPDRIRIKKRKGVQYQRKLKEFIEDYNKGNIMAEALLDSVIAWNNHARYGNTLNLRKKMFLCLPNEISRMAYWQYKRSIERNSHITL